MSGEEQNWEEISDEEIATMSAPPSGESGKENSKEAGADPAASKESTEELDTAGNAKGVTDGADDSGNPEGDSDESDDNLEEGSSDSTTQDSLDGETSESAKGDQSEGKQTDQDTSKKADVGEVDFKSKYEEIMSPFKAAGRMISLDTPEQVRRLLSMGADYNQKMQHLKPFRRVLQTLQQADLLDPDRINFLIDLDKKNPAAIKKLLKDSSFDSRDMDLEDDVDKYSPTDHSVSEVEMGVREAFEALDSEPTFGKTVQVLTKEWDGKSRSALADNPNMIGLMHRHIADGTYEKVWGEVVKLRVLGDLVGLSDLEAYDVTGQAMAKSGKLADPQSAQANSSDTAATQASAQGNGSPDAKQKAAQQKRAASPTRGGASGGGTPQIPKLEDMSDEQVLNFDLRKLSKL